ncbi:MAG: ABC transporter permease [Anaerolineae bacterium]|nr:ABC transporter permease [Anaerolineae bacterium]
MTTLRNTFKELLRYPSAIFGLAIIALLIAVSIYAVIAIPYKEAIRLWRGGVGIWDQYPRNAPPAWTNLFRSQKVPETLFLSTEDETAEKVFYPGDNDVNTIVITYTLDYQFDTFPDDMSLFFSAKYEQKQPYLSISWLTPAGESVRVADFSSGRSKTYPFSQDTKLQRRLAGLLPHEALFVADPKAGLTAPVRGVYKLRISATTFEPDSDVDAEFVMFGKVYGLAGTDHLRRDLMVALLWGTPVALAFGLVAALGTTITTMIIAAISTWFGGWVDAIIQRITAVNMVLPFLPILIMIGTFYSRSIVVILGATVALSIFTGSIMTYRAIFLQVKEAPYIEAARAYGAGSWRIIFSYLTPRIIPMLIPGLVAAIPGFVFLEAALAVLGLGDPSLPTWGKIISDAQGNGALYKGLYYWVLEPAALLVLAGLAFAMLGFSLDRIFNPRLRGL